METLIINQQNSVDYNPEVEKIILQAASRAAAILALAANTELSILLVDNAYIKELNNIYRGVNQETDVLSFAMNELEEEDPVSGLTGEVNLLGDVVISLEKALAQSKEYGHSFSRELSYLLVHGLLHLLGFDHEDESGVAAMRECEEEIMRSLSLER